MLYVNIILKNTFIIFCEIEKGMAFKCHYMQNDNEVFHEHW